MTMLKPEEDARDILRVLLNYLKVKIQNSK